jgi:SAM-dependent methyltransferase
LILDYSTKEWLESVKKNSPYDVIISSLSIHHQPDERKKEVYKEIFDLLSPGGIFIHLEHVSSPTKLVEDTFDDYFVDKLYETHKKNGQTKTRELIYDSFINRPDKVANLLVPVEDQCNWLREIGFADVDCFFKIFGVAIFGGRKV